MAGGRRTGEALPAGQGGFSQKFWQAMGKSGAALQEKDRSGGPQRM
jgi:hypothetical protein